MTRLEFGAFLAPHHPIGEHPTLMFQRDLEFAAHLDRLGFDDGEEQGCLALPTSAGGKARQI